MYDLHIMNGFGWYLKVVSSFPCEVLWRIKNILVFMYYSIGKVTK